MAKRRSLQEDTVALKTKVKESSAKSENPEGKFGYPVSAKTIKADATKNSVCQKAGSRTDS